MTDLSITPANVVWIGGTAMKNGTAGGTVAQGEVLYKDTSDSNHLKLADASAAASAVVEGIALNSAEDGQPVAYAPDGAQINVGGSTVAGTNYVLSATAGGIAPEADILQGEYVSTLFVGSGSAVVTISINNSGIAHA